MNPSTDQKLMKRIRRLLAMAQSKNSPRESAIAAHRVRALMDAHHIKDSDLDFTESTIDSCIIMNVDADTPNWMLVIANSIATMNDCVAVSYSTGIADKRQVILHGHADDVDLACTMIDSITNTIVDACAASRLVTSRSGDEAIKAMSDFCAGFATALCNRIVAVIQHRQTSVISSTGTNLVISKKAAIDTHMDSKSIKLQPNRKITLSSAPDTNDFWAGFAAGQAHDIQQGITNAHDCPLDDSCIDQGCPFHYADGSPTNQMYLDIGYENRRTYLTALANDRDLEFSFVYILSNQMGWQNDLTGLEQTLSN